MTSSMAVKRGREFNEKFNQFKMKICNYTLEFIFNHFNKSINQVMRIPLSIMSRELYNEILCGTRLNYLPHENVE